MPAPDEEEATWVGPMPGGASWSTDLLGGVDVSIDFADPEPHDVDTDVIEMRFSPGTLFDDLRGLVERLRARDRADDAETVQRLVTLLRVGPT